MHKEISIPVRINFAWLPCIAALADCHVVTLIDCTMKKGVCRCQEHHRVAFEVGLKRIQILSNPSPNWVIERIPGTREYHWTPNHVLESHWLLVVIEAETHHLWSMLSLIGDKTVAAAFQKRISTRTLWQLQPEQVLLISSLLQIQNGRLSNPNTCNRVVRVLRGTG